MKTAKLVLGMLLLSAFFIAFFINRYHYSRLGAAVLSRELSRRVDYEIGIDRLGGNFIRTFTLEGIKIRSADSLLAECSRIEITYTLFDAIRSPHRFRKVVLQHPRVVLSAGSGNSDSSGQADFQTAFPMNLSFAIDTLAIHHGHLERGNQTASDFDLLASITPIANGGTALRIFRSTTRILPSVEGEIPLEFSGYLAWSEADACTLALDGSSGSSSFRNAGHLSLGKPATVRGRIRVQSDDIIGLLDRAGLPTGLDRAEGDLVIDYDGGMDSSAVHISGSLAVNEIDAEEIEISGLLLGSSLRVDQFEGLFNGAVVSGDGRLDLDPKGSSGFRIFFNTIDVSRFAPGFAGGRSSDLNGEVRWSGSGRDLADLRGRVTLTLVRSRFGFVTIRGASINGLLGEKILTIADSRIATRSSEIEFSGSVGLDGHVDGEVHADLPNLREFRALTPFDSLGGEVQFSGNISGSFDRFRAEGSARIQEGQLENIYAKSADLNGWLEVDFGRITAGGKISVDSILLGGEAIDSLTMIAAFDDTLILIEDITADRDEWSFVAAGEASVAGSLRTVEFREIRVTKGDTLIARPDVVRLWKRGDLLGIDPLDVVVGNGTVRISGESGPGDTIRASLDMDRADLSILAPRLRLPASFLRSVTMKGNLGGTRDKPTGSIELRIEEASGDSLPIRGIALAAGLDGDKLRIDSLVVLGMAEGSRCYLAGELPVPLDREGSPIHLEVSLRQFPLVELHPLISQLESFEGLAHLDGTVGGTWSAPYADITFHVKETLLNGYPVGTIRVDSLRLGGDSLAAVLLFDRSWGEKSRAFIRLPVRASLENQDIDIMDHGPIRTDVFITEGDFGVVSTLTDLVEESGGPFRLDATIRGDYSDPQADGTFDLKDGFLLLTDMTPFFERIEARVLIDEDYLTIVNASARSGKKGRLEAWGRVDVDGFLPVSYEIGAHARNYTMELTDDLIVTFDGDFTLEPDETVFQTVVPRIAGEADIKELEIELRYEIPPEGAKNIFEPTADPGWTCSLYVRAPRNVIVRDPNLDAEVGGEVEITKSSRGFGAIGEFDVIHGSYWLYNNQFRVVEGKLVFADPYDMRKVNIDVTANTSILGERIDMQVLGTPDSLTVLPSSESGWTETEIITALTFRATPSESASQSVLIASWAAALASRLSRKMAQKWRANLGAFEIGTSNDLPELRYGTHLSSELFLGYAQTLGDPLTTKVKSGYQENLPIPERRVRVEYRLRRLLIVEGEAGTFTDGDRFLNLDLKMKVPY